MEKRTIPADFSFTNLFAPKPPGKINEGGYPYFSGIHERPFQAGMQGLSLVNALWLAECSLLVYVRDPETVQSTLRGAGFSDATCFRFDQKGAQSFVAHNDDIIVVCFRGTEVEERKDVWHDIQFIKVDSGQAGKQWSTGRARTGGGVHKGFKDALDQVWDEMAEHLSNIHTGQKVWITGHSLGAAMAVLAADRYDSAQGVYTFGSPGVGDDDFIHDYPVTANTFRFVNNNDGVTRAAPEILGSNIFGHVGQLIYIDHDGHLQDETNTGGWSIWLDGVMGFFSHLEDSMKSAIQSGRIDQLPLDNLTDHSPLHYCIHIWNSISR